MKIKEAAAIWGISERRVNELCKTGRIPGAYKTGKSWFIPDGAVKPADNRFIHSSSPFYNPHPLKPLPIGISDFKEATQHYYYVDKTLLIRDLLDEKNKVILFTRPRRFGKTLNMDMLKTFFEKTDSDTSIFFKDKLIWKCGRNYQKEQGKYPVIFFSFKDLHQSDWQSTYKFLTKLIANEAQRHIELYDSQVLTAYERIQFSKLANETGDEADSQMALQTLSALLHKHHKIAPVIIIDEYDTPIQQGYIKGFYEEAVQFMRNFFSGGFKDNQHLSYGFLTGILRVAKESIFSGLNNLKVNSILSDSYGAYFGFTSDEVKTMAQLYGAYSNYKEICDWYDGYVFCNTEIFNPWSVVSYFDNNCHPEPFWQSTSSNDIIREILASANDNILEKLSQLMLGKSFVAHIDTSVIYPEIKNNPASVFSFLLVAGYLKAVRHEKYLGEDFLCELALPNREISYVFRKEILSLPKTSFARSSASLIQEAIWHNDFKSLQEALEQFLMRTISYFDTASESFYHGLLLGMCAMMDDKYKITSNREAGHGRFDIQLFPQRDDLCGILIEIKTGKQCSDEQLLKLSDTALKQILKKNYVRDMTDSHVPSILAFGVAFDGKRAKISSKELTK